VLPAVYFGAGSRYFYPLQLIALWLVIEAAVAAQPILARYARLALMLIALLNIPRMREPAFTDLEWSEYASAIRRGEEVIVPTNPSWEFTMPGNSTIARARRTVPRTALVNVSTRCWISPAQPAVVGFALHEGQPRKLLVRVIGPSLAKFGVKTPIARPKATLMLNAREEPTFVAKRDPANDAAIKAATDLCRAFALEPGFADLAGIAVLGPGIYSLVISSEVDATGEVLVEIYEIPPEPRLEK
jgi:hypothetical protein